MGSRRKRRVLPGEKTNFTAREVEKTEKGDERSISVRALIGKRKGDKSNATNGPRARRWGAEGEVPTIQD